MKAMKKLTQCLCALALVVSTTSALALNSGTWDLTTGLNNGTWTETFGLNGPGSAGSVIAATDGGQWGIGFLTSQGAVAGVPAGWYDTTYTGGTLTLGNEAGMWGNGVTINGVTLQNHSQFTVIGGFDYLTFGFTATGTYGGQTVILSGSFMGDNNPNGLHNYSIVEHQPHVDGDGQNGNPFNTLTITVVPDGGSTLLLLGAALSTIGLLRRKLLA